MSNNIFALPSSTENDVRYYRPILCIYKYTYN